MSVLAAVKLILTPMLVARLGIGGAPLASTVSYAAGFLSSVILLSYSARARASVLSGLCKPLTSALLSVLCARAVFEGHFGGDGAVAFLISAALAATIYLFLMTVLHLKRIISSLKLVNFNKKAEA